VKSHNPEPTKHPDELLLLYVENMLGPDEKIKVETHLGECKECTSRVQALRATITALKNGPEIFCPEPWEIYEFVKEGKPEGSVSSHLGLCSSCRLEAVQYETASLEPMPAGLWNIIKERISRVPGRSGLEPEKAPGFMERLHEWFKLPAIAMGAAVAALLVVLVLYPRAPIQTDVGLTSVTWEGVLKPKSFQKATVLLVLKNVKPPLSQARIDSLYEALKPDMDVSARFGMLSPAVVSAAIKNREIDTDNEKRLLSDLHSKYSVSLAVLVHMSRKGETYDVRVNMMDPISGKELRTTMLRDVPDGRLNEQVREAVKGLLLQEK
jgi:hypothetical protein